MKKSILVIGALACAQSAFAQVQPQIIINKPDLSQDAVRVASMLVEAGMQGNPVLKQVVENGPLCSVTGTGLARVGNTTQTVVVADIGGSCVSGPASLTNPTLFPMRRATIIMDSVRKASE